MGTGRNPLNALTSLKGLFILIIVFHNTTMNNPLFSFVPGAAFLTLFGGALGNSIFFILSGFLLSYNYRDRIRSHAISFDAYLLKRLRKLYPMFVITNLAALALAVLQYGLSVIDLKKLALTFLLQMGGGLENGNPYNSPTWFVSTLLLCYLVYFFAACHAKSNTQYWCSIVLGIAWGYGLMKLNILFPFCYQETGIGLMNFSIGCVLAEVCPRIRESIHKWMRPLCFGALLFFLMLIFRYGVEIICGDVHTAFALLICPMIIYLAAAGGICTRILQWKFFVGLGKVSVSIFFWHLVCYNGFTFVLSLVRPDMALQEGLYLLYFGLMLLWCCCSHGFLEPYISRKLDGTPRKTSAETMISQ